MRKMQEGSLGFFLDFSAELGARQVFVVALTYAGTPVHSDGRNGKDCTLCLLTLFPFVDLFQFKSHGSWGDFMLWKNVTHWSLVCTT